MSESGFALEIENLHKSFDRPAVDGTVRDSAVFSLLAADWPDARRRLEERLAR